MCSLEPWQVRRSEFNHDWLANRYLNSFRAFMRRLREPGVSIERLCEFLDEDMPQWLEYRAVAADLVQTFESEMSPIVLMNRSPLDGLDAGSKAWLGPLVHAIWLVRTPVRLWVAEALQAIEHVDIAYQAVCNGLEGIEVTVHALREREAGFQALQDALVTLSTAFSRFPQRIMAA